MNLKYKTRPTSINKLRDIAMDFRHKHNIKQIYFPIYEIIDELYLDNLLNVIIVEDEDYTVLKKFEYASYEIKTNTIYIRYSVYQSASNGDGEARFTLAHELSHYLLLNVYDFGIFKTNENIKSFENPEWQADNLAFELLAPRNLTIDYSVNDYVENCKITKACAKYIFYKRNKQKETLPKEFKKISDIGYPKDFDNCVFRYYDNDKLIKKTGIYLKDEHIFFFDSKNQYIEMDESRIIDYYVIEPITNKNNSFYTMNIEFNNLDDWTSEDRRRIKRYFCSLIIRQGLFLIYYNNDFLALRAYDNNKKDFKTMMNLFFYLKSEFKDFDSVFKNMYIWISNGFMKAPHRIYDLINQKITMINYIK